MDLMENAKEVDFNSFYNEVKAIEKRDSVLTSEQQISRLLRPGSLYFNLNPFEVLRIDPETSLDEARTKFKRLSLLVHPDKNPDDKERAQQAFEVVRKAWSVLENEDTRQRCMLIIEEAKERTDMMVNEKRRKNKKGEPIEEDVPENYKRSMYVMTMKLFAEAEKRRRNLEVRNMEEKKRQREQEIEEEQKLAMQKEWQKNFDESRQNRVESWKQFQAGASSKKKVKKLKTAFKPPRHKAETR